MREETAMRRLLQTTIWEHGNTKGIHLSTENIIRKRLADKQDNERRKDDGKRNSVPYDRVDGGVRRGEIGVSLADLILWAITEAVKVDGYEIEKVGE